MSTFNKVVIFGVGLIGGSFALALKRAGAVRDVVGVGRRRETLERALALGIIDTIGDASSVAGADLVLLAAPVAQTESLLRDMAPYLQPGTVVTDAGSTKSDVVAAARKALGDKIAQFVPGHPIAGRDARGCRCGGVAARGGADGGSLRRRGRRHRRDWIGGVAACGWTEKGGM